MKVRIEIDCTPIEARRFLGLPDVEAFQAEMMRQMQEKLSKGLTPEDMEQFAKTWTPLGGPGWDSMQKIFWNAATGGGDKK